MTAQRPRARSASLLVWLIVLAAGASILVAAGMVGGAALGHALLSSIAGGLAAGLVALLLADVGLQRLSARRRLPAGGWFGRPWPRRLLITAFAALLSLNWLVPGLGSGPQEPGNSALVTQWLARPDGSRLAVHVTRAAHATQPPLLVVHGGPGVADMTHDVPAFAALASDRDVYVYDRVGTGASSRLADPRGYTIGRAVSDLEALRRAIGADRVVLHGHSWGARIVVAYAQDHPGRVAALILSAPGDLPLDGGPVTPGDLTTRLSGAQRVRLYLRLARPRNLFTYALTAGDARVAHALAGDREMDGRFAAIYRASTPALFCDSRLANRVGTAGVGYYAHYVPQLHPDPTDEPVDLVWLARVRVPLLLIKPACDYLPWSTAGYRRAFPQAVLVMIPGAGHVAYLEQPALYVDLIEAFLDREPLPLPTIVGSAIPKDYRGTR